jgi:prepilin-type processing-associated H-X9-DG protein
VELVVTIVSILLLSSVALPALEDSLETARRLQCQQHLEVIGKGVAAYEAAKGHLPRAGYWDPIYGGWGATLLPFIGQEELANRYDYSRDWFDQVNQSTVQVAVPGLLCPASPEAAPVTPLEIKGEERADLSAATGDYMAPRGFVDKRLAPDVQFGPLGALAWFNEIPRRSQITDGLSNTIMISEQAARWGHWVRGQLQSDQDKQTYGRWVGAWASYNAIWVRVRGRNDGDSSNSCGVNCNNSDGFYSFHPQGVNALMADGSVRWMNANIEDAVLCSLVSRAGGEIVAEGEY